MKKKQIILSSPFFCLLFRKMNKKNSHYSFFFLQCRCLLYFGCGSSRKDVVLFFVLDRFGFCFKDFLHPSLSLHISMEKSSTIIGYRLGYSS